MRCSIVKRVAMLVGLVAAVAACTMGPQPEPGIASQTISPSMGQESFAFESVDTYALRPADVLRITVFREEDLSQERIAIDADGLISLPLLGSVQAAGLTVDGLAQEVEQMLNARYLRNADVSINVVEFASHKVTVEGAVETPGVYEFQPGLRLSGAIALAEGTRRVADSRNIAVFRRTPEGMAVAKFDYRAMQEGAMIDPILLPHDRVVVGTNGLSQAWQDVLQAIPVFAVFTNLRSRN